MPTDSGHSDQQEAVNDEEEEDGMDESAHFFFPRVPSLMCARLVIIPSDEKPIIDDVRLLRYPSLPHVFTDKLPGAQKIAC